MIAIPGLPGSPLDSHLVIPGTLEGGKVGRPLEGDCSKFHPPSADNRGVCYSRFTGMRAPLEQYIYQLTTLFCHQRKYIAPIQTHATKFNFSNTRYQNRHIQCCCNPDGPPRPHLSNRFTIFTNALIQPAPIESMLATPCSVIPEISLHFRSQTTFTFPSCTTARCNTWVVIKSC